MIMKNGAPYQTLTRIVENRAYAPTPSHGTLLSPTSSSSQLMAEYCGSNIHHHVSVDMAGGITHGTSSSPRQMRCLVVGMLCMRWATTKPISALKNTALSANRQDWNSTSWNVWRFSRNEKLASPTKVVIFLFSIASSIA